MIILLKKITVKNKSSKRPWFLRIILIPKMFYFNCFLSNATRESSVADPDPGSGTFLTPGSGIEKIQTGDMGSGMNTPDLIFELKTLQFFDADPEQGSGILSTLDLGAGMENIGSGINTPDPQHSEIVTNIH